mmetsp:Transcript_24458/g.38677  ORF Transcript_24458/g.38677 Transcript_24458/m.38677 type:complete len:262 (+) Transcript_24458:408-1193(+)
MPQSAGAFPLSGWGHGVSETCSNYWAECHMRSTDSAQKLGNFSGGHGSLPSKGFRFCVSVDWTHEPQCPICHVLETVDHALSGCRFHALALNLLDQPWAPTAQGNALHTARSLPVGLSLATPIGVRLWIARASHWSLRCALRQNLSVPSFDTFLTKWITLLDLVCCWQGFSHLTDPFLSFKNKLLSFLSSGALPPTKIKVVRPEPSTPERERKRHRSDHKQQLAEGAQQVLVRLGQQGYAVAWTDSSAKWGRHRLWGHHPG